MPDLKQRKLSQSDQVFLAFAFVQALVSMGIFALLPGIFSIRSVVLLSGEVGIGCLLSGLMAVWCPIKWRKELIGVYYLILVFSWVLFS
jgi:hypothetical protein